MLAAFGVAVLVQVARGNVEEGWRSPVIALGVALIVGAIVMPVRDRPQIVIAADGVGLAARPGGTTSWWTPWTSISMLEVADDGEFWLVWAAGVELMRSRNVASALGRASRDTRRSALARFPANGGLLVLHVGRLSDTDRRRLVAAFSAHGFEGLSIEN